jgi:hypothetical protein
MIYPSRGSRARSAYPAKIGSAQSERFQLLAAPAYQHFTLVMLGGNMLANNTGRGQHVNGFLTAVLGVTALLDFQLQRIQKVYFFESVLDNLGVATFISTGHVRLGISTSCFAGLCADIILVVVRPYTDILYDILLKAAYHLLQITPVAMHLLHAAQNI